jgi:hypothetical protein
MISCGHADFVIRGAEADAGVQCHLRRLGSVHNNEKQQENSGPLAVIWLLKASAAQDFRREQNLDR